jgi:hypothetical protein
MKQRNASDLLVVKTGSQSCRIASYSLALLEYAGEVRRERWLGIYCCLYHHVTRFHLTPRDVDGIFEKIEMASPMSVYIIV